MKYVIDIETNRLENPDRIWVVVMKDIDSGTYQTYYDLTKREEERERFIRSIETLRAGSGLLIGHNLLGFDWPVLCSLIQMDNPDGTDFLLDTLIISKLVDYSRQGHSIEDYGLEFDYEKIKFSDFSKYSPDMEEYCKRDCDICEKIYRKYSRYISNRAHHDSIITEHRFQSVVNDLHTNGFAFNSSRARSMLDKVTAELSVLDKDILEAFPPRLHLIREITPKETKYGTLNRSDFRWVTSGDLSEYNGGSFCRCEWRSFNPSSHKQILAVLNSAGWMPVDKTKTHLDTERAFNQLRRRKGDLSEVAERLQELKVTGWKVNETNLETLPSSAPKPARLLAKRILLEARRRTLTEWLELVHCVIEIDKTNFIEIGTVERNSTQSGLQKSENNEEVGNSLMQTGSVKIINETTSNTITDYRSKKLLEWLRSNKVSVLSANENANSMLITVIGQEMSEKCCAALATVPLDGSRNFQPKYKVISNRIHGRFQGIGAWSHRMAHQQPNTANIPNELDTAGKKKLLGKEMRALWCAPKNRLLVGCDAEGIQLRVFAHYINDPEFTDALVKGRKDDKTDPHSLNQRILGSVCRSRAAAKRFIYALLLGAGTGKLTEILGGTEQETTAALERLLSRYRGWQTLREEVFPKDAKRGWFVGLDGRKVRIPGESDGSRRHLAMSGYLQNGEAVAMKLATLKFYPKLKELDAKLVNFVHDEWQVECPNDVSVAIKIGQMMADSLKEVGEDLKLNCPLAGSIWNDDLRDYTIGTNWAYTH